MAETISLGELIRDALESRLSEFSVALPGKVKSYDADTQRADVELELQRLVPDGEGGHVPQTLPVLPEVPVCFPQGGNGYFISFPLTAGDKVLVVFCDAPIGAWVAKGALSEPTTAEMHGLGGAVCYPGLRSAKNPIADADASAMVLGKDGTAGAQVKITSSEVQLGTGATKKAARGGDTLTTSAVLTTWAQAVELAINTIAPGSITTLWAAAPGLAGGLGTINASSCSSVIKVKD